jgi:hypothetical protein
VLLAVDKKAGGAAEMQNVGRCFDSFDERGATAHQHISTLQLHRAMLVARQTKAEAEAEAEAEREDAHSSNSSQQHGLALMKTKSGTKKKASVRVAALFFWCGS